MVRVLTFAELLSQERTIQICLLHSGGKKRPTEAPKVRMKLLD